MKKIWVAILSLILLSCSASKKLDQIHYKQPILTAKKCASWYPIREYEREVTKYLPGKTDTFTNTIEIDCRDTANRNKVVYKNCVSTHTRDTLSRDREMTKESTAQADYYKLLLDETVAAKHAYEISSEKSISTLKEKNKQLSKWNSRLLWISGCTVALFALLQFGWAGKLLKVIKSLF